MLLYLFCLNKFNDKSDKLSDMLEKHLKKSFKIARLHGSRDYFQIRQGKFTFEIIPMPLSAEEKLSDAPYHAVRGDARHDGIVRAPGG